MLMFPFYPAIHTFHLFTCTHDLFFFKSSAEYLIFHYTHQSVIKYQTSDNENKRIPILYRYFKVWFRRPYVLYVLYALFISLGLFFEFFFEISLSQITASARHSFSLPSTELIFFVEHSWIIHLIMHKLMMPLSRYFHFLVNPLSTVCRSLPADVSIIR